MWRSRIAISKWVCPNRTSNPLGGWQFPPASAREEPARKGAGHSCISSGHKLSRYRAIIRAILIACLGLFGLVTFTVKTRTKEIGIRKVLGASAASILSLLPGEFLALLLVSLAIASPVAWLFMDRWLRDFAYRITIGWEAFALAGLIALVLVVLTISLQALRAATANPVRSLRTE
ncbi:MAG TPA: FtsX-like permease family protein [Chitinophagaceae bacterium]|nr:FtsX-like permease family protein [Chitinophagaceae bacterium]